MLSVVLMRSAPALLNRAPRNSSRLAVRSEEHTSELQSLAYLVCRLLLEKKNNVQIQPTLHHRRFEDIVSHEERTAVLLQELAGRECRNVFHWPRFGIDGAHQRHTRPRVR